MAISLLYNPYPIRMFEYDGDFASGALAYFYLARTTTPLTVFTDNPCTVPHTWPVVADAFGLFAPIYIQKGQEYKVRIEDAANNILYAADGIANPQETDTSGLVVTADRLFQTGDIMWNAASMTRLGWVRCNGTTISDAAGSGAQYRNDDAAALFAYFWDNFTNTICPVVGGRGPNATADFTSHKEIATLDMRGRSIAGLDDMGSVARNLAQYTTTINTTNANALAVVADATNLSRGMYIISANVPAGTTIIQVNPTTKNVAMSANATATATGTTARFSVFLDAQVPGIGGGRGSWILSDYEMPSHIHNTSATDSEIIAVRTNIGPAYDHVVGNSFAQGTMNPAGQDAAHSIWNPTVLGSYYAKL